MKAVVKKWGNTASVRIPSAVLQAAKLRLEDSVDVREESGRIIIEPAPGNEYALSELLKKITLENLREEVDFCKPVSKKRDGWPGLNIETRLAAPGLVYKPAF